MCTHECLKECVCVFCLLFQLNKLRQSSPVEKESHRESIRIVSTLSFAFIHSMIAHRSPLEFN